MREYHPRTLESEEDISRELPNAGTYVMRLSLDGILVISLHGGISISTPWDIAPQAVPCEMILYWVTLYEAIPRGGSSLEAIPLATASAGCFCERDFRPHRLPGIQNCADDIFIAEQCRRLLFHGHA